MAFVIFVSTDILLVILFFFFSIKSTVQLRKLSVPANTLLARRAFNQPNHNLKRFQSQSNSLLGPSLFCISVIS